MTTILMSPELPPSKLQSQIIFRDDAMLHGNYSMKDTKDARGKGYTFHRYVRLFSGQVSTLKSSNKKCRRLSTELIGFDLDATLWRPAHFRISND